jgi:tetratricopeptide (TPR) repeat protein
MTIARVAAIVIAAASFSGCAILHPETSERSRASQTEERGRRAMQYFIKAKTFEEQKNYLGAIVALRSAADLDPTSATIYRQLAHNYGRIGDYEMAIRFARRTLQLQPIDNDLRYDLVRWLETVRDRKNAAAALEELIEYDPDTWPLYSQLANIYLEIGQLSNVSDLFARLLQRPDLPPEVMVNAAYVLARSGQHSQATGIFKEVLVADPNVEDAWLGLAEVDISQGRRDEAIGILRRGSRQLPESQLIMYELARALATSIDLRSILEEEDAEFLYRLGVSLSGQEKYGLAALAFERIVGLNPNSVDGWLEPIQYYVQVEEIERAEELLEQATAAMPDSVDLYLFWAGVLEELQRHDEAFAVYEQGVGRRPDAVELYVFWGFALEELERWSGAIEVYKRGIRATDDDTRLYIRWGITLGRQERWQESISRYMKAAAASKADSSRGDALLHWGIALEKMERWDQAVEILDEANGLTPDDTLCLFYLGSCLEQASRAVEDSTYLTRSIETFEHLIEIDPNDAFALNYLGYMYAERGIHLPEAVELLTRAVSLDPENGAFFDSLGWAHFRLGQLDKAERNLHTALSLMADGDSAEQAVIYDHAGDVAGALGKSDEAAKHWRRALDLVPENEEVLHKLEDTSP